MVYILSGPINTGKSTWLMEDFKKRNNADGFACRKVKVNGIHIGYELVHLKTGEICQFIRTIDYIPENWNEAFRIGMRYSFSKEGLAFATKIAHEALQNKVDFFYLDEVAHLEVKGQGFADILKRILASGIDLMLVVRESMVEKIVNAFGISEYNVITPK